MLTKYDFFMRHLIIDAVEDEYYRPVVDFNPDTGVCEISGESYLEQVNDFFNPLTDWIKEYTNSDKDKLVFNFKLSYYNTSSSKKLLEMLKIISDFANNGKTVEINWYYEAGDTDILEDAEDFMMITGLNFNLIKKDKSEHKKLL